MLVMRKYGTRVAGVTAVTLLLAAYACDGAGTGPAIGSLGYVIVAEEGLSNKGVYVLEAATGELYFSFDTQLEGLWTIDMDIDRETGDVYVYAVDSIFKYD